MSFRYRWEEIAYEILEDDSESFIHLTKRDRKRIAQKIGEKVAGEIGHV